ncbi:group III truncated hemoglobin [Taibaiella koreensis]|uniref:group III truncated hemoglobin n=1 Tax=Taibaiella koreensis TaxID=1268548 RepID=UPI000E59E991|nr:group III truncated hemoglobin [Taibaiella koreensis]
MAPADIQNREDIELLVNEFYTKVREDALIGPLFQATIASKWPEHLSKMYAFWETVLLDRHTYSGAPFMPHARLPLEPEHFERWLQLFDRTLDTHFAGPVADDARARASKMAVMFQAKLEYLKEHGSFKPLF